MASALRATARPTMAWWPAMSSCSASNDRAGSWYYYMVAYNAVNAF